MRKGEYISVSILFNKLTKFGKLSVGNKIVSAKKKHKKDPLFPLVLTLTGLSPLNKVWVDYIPHPKNTFVIKVNDADIQSYDEEWVDLDPSKADTLSVFLNIND